MLRGLRWTSGCSKARKWKWCADTPFAPSRYNATFVCTQLKRRSPPYSIRKEEDDVRPCTDGVVTSHNCSDQQIWLVRYFVVRITLLDQVTQTTQVGRE
uniref:Uncharacterized protein n=1 Tax=Peronospora matthiolae TaxID=2874970 RepID=A0AAV1VCU9_9STRA